MAGGIAGQEDAENSHEVLSQQQLSVEGVEDLTLWPKGRSCSTMSPSVDHI